MELAHEMAIAMQSVEPITDMKLLASLCFQYADAMQAEADNREKEEAAQKRKEIRDMLTHPNTFVEREGQHFDDVEEWQPDWSQAPEWANWWAIDGFGDKKAHWYRDKPYLDDDSLIEDEWNATLDSQKHSFVKAPSFNYKGDWLESLRERPL